MWQESQGTTAKPFPYLSWLKGLWGTKGLCTCHMGPSCSKNSILKGQGQHSLGITSPLCPTAWHSQLAHKQPLPVHRVVAAAG